VPKLLRRAAAETYSHTAANSQPRWSRNGKEMFYIQQRKLMAVSVATHPTFSPGTPAILFEKCSLAVANYDVAADAKRLIILDRANEKPLLIHVVNNWFEEFRGR
jgi:hypothetical protein